MPTYTCSPAVDPLISPNAANVDDFITAFAMIEAIELSNLDSPGDTIDCTRINKALSDAYNLIQSAKVALAAQQIPVVDANLNRWMLIIARYYLDTIRRRPDVTYDYENVMKQIGSLGPRINSVRHVRHTEGKTPHYTEASLARFNSNRQF